MNISYNFCTNCGESLQPISDPGLEQPIKECSSCDFKIWNDPKVVAATVVLHKEKILLVERIDAPNESLWSLPAGFVNRNENPEQTAIREVSEETGIKCLPMHILGVNYSDGIILIVYKAELSDKSDIQTPLTAVNELKNTGWYPLEDIPALQFPHDWLYIDRAIRSQGLPLDGPSAEPYEQGID